MDPDRAAVAPPALVLIPQAPTDAPGPSPWAAGRAMLARGLRLAWRRPADAATSAGFFLLVGALVALATAPAGLPAPLTAAVAAWVGALLATLLAQQQGMREEAAAGMLDQLRLAPGGALAPVAGLLAAQVVATVVPLVLATPAIALFFQLSVAQGVALAVSLLAGLPVVVVLALFAATLTLASRTTPAALGLLVLPLAVPVLLFGVRAADPAAGAGALWLLCACSLVAATLGPFAIAAALSLEDAA
ncbi:heme exporter protein CcmB [Ramlibacter sp. USB13]|uniref:Heme exporter protein CcmB n=1 Tax=Ramlibacter cellulosilyticus TaxID=2764187 RepID=A0A923MQT1_9BURK|nr:heme exporter protein CcmB [Ramlibacter cellulosilyticus]MBC5784112.1 heme exporter protein CcmB [Ramlibacter cellulosilyticus]